MPVLVKLNVPAAQIATPRETEGTTGRSAAGALPAAGAFRLKWKVFGSAAFE